MQRHPSMFRRGLLIWSLTLVATSVSAAWAQGEPPSPWTAERANALVRIEAPGKHPAPDVATGFIVNGHGGKQYVATVTHGLLPTATETQVEAFKPDDCDLLPDGQLGRCDLLHTPWMITGLFCRIWADEPTGAAQRSWIGREHEGRATSCLDCCLMYLFLALQCCSA
jgi:hypothetical protein